MKLSVLLCLAVVYTGGVRSFPANDQLPLQQDEAVKAIPRDPDAIVYPDQITRDSYGNAVTPFNGLAKDHGIGHMTDINKNDKLDDRGDFEAGKKDSSGFVIPSYASGIMKVETLLPPTAPIFPAVAPTKADAGLNFNQIEVVDKILPPYREDEAKVNYPHIEVNTQATIFFPDSNFLNQIASHNHQFGHKEQPAGSPPAKAPVHNKPNFGAATHPPPQQPFNSPQLPPAVIPTKAPANAISGDIYTGGFGGPSGVLGTGNVHYHQPINSPQVPPTLSPPVNAPVNNNNQGQNEEVYTGGFGGPPGILGTGNVNYHQPINSPQVPPTLSSPPKAPVNNIQGQKEEVYTGGFGGPSGVLGTGNVNYHPHNKPAQVPPTLSPPVNAPVNNNNQGQNEEVYTGGFGGPPGILGTGNVNYQQSNKTPQGPPPVPVNNNAGGIYTGIFGGAPDPILQQPSLPQVPPTIISTPITVPAPHKPHQEGEVYTGGFGGAPGVLGNSNSVGYGVKNPHAGNPISQAPAASPVIPSPSLELPNVPSQPVARPVLNQPQLQNPPHPTQLAPTSFQQGSFILDLNLLPPSLPSSSPGSGSLSPLPQKPVVVVPPVSTNVVPPPAGQTSHHHHHHHYNRPVGPSSDVYQGGFGGPPGLLKPYDNGGHHHHH